MLRKPRGDIGDILSIDCTTPLTVQSPLHTGIEAEHRGVKMRLMIRKGPNLNLVGVREPHICGATSLSEIESQCLALGEHLGARADFHQSNHEGALVDLIQGARGVADAIIINPAGYSFSSVAIIDALKAFEGPVVEAHISNIHARDEHHRHSKISAHVKAVICGLGPYGYLVAMLATAKMTGNLPDALPAALRVPASW